MMNVKLNCFIPRISHIGDGEILDLSGCDFSHIGGLTHVGKKIPVFHNNIQVGKATIEQEGNHFNSVIELDKMDEVSINKMLNTTKQLLASKKPLHYGIGYSIDAEGNMNLKEVSIIAPPKK